MTHFGWFSLIYFLVGCVIYFCVLLSKEYRRHHHPSMTITSFFSSFFLCIATWPMLLVMVILDRKDRS